MHLSIRDYLVLGNIMKLNISIIRIQKSMFLKMHWLLLIIANHLVHERHKNWIVAI